MIPLTAKEIAEMVGGRLAGDADALATRVAIDSRAVRKGDLFVALRGEHTDGHAFIDDAVAHGASVVLVREDAGPIVGAAAIGVDEPEAGLLRLAAAVRPRLAARIVAITGSSGKTVTKELAAAVLRPRYRTVASRASFNNEIGVPLTVLSADADTEVIVAEMGARGIGHIAALVHVVRPDVGVVLNVGEAHIGMFGSVEAIAQAKGELVEGLPGDGAAVLNADDAAVAAMASRTRARTITFGAGAGADVRALDVAVGADACASFTLAEGEHRATVRLRIPGEHLVSDAAAAAAAGLALNVSLADAAAALSTASGPAWRMEVTNAAGGWVVINDAYNANPSSVTAALKTLATMGRGSRTWAVLGYMAELGDRSDAEHDRIGRLAVRLGVSRLVAVGEESRPLYEAARLEGMTPEEASLVDDADAAIGLLRSALEAGDVVLVKASRVVGLERVAFALTGEGP